MDQIASDLEWLRLNALTDGTDAAATRLTRADSQDQAGDHPEAEEAAHDGVASKTSTDKAPLWIAPLVALEPCHLTVSTPHAQTPATAATTAPTTTTTAATSTSAASADSAFTAAVMDGVLGDVQRELLAAQQGEKDSQAALQLMRGQLADAQREAEQHRLVGERLCRQVALYESDLHAVESLTESLQITVQGLHDSVRAAWEAKEAVHRTLTAAQVQLEAYDALKIVYAGAKAELEALNAQRDHMTREAAELHQLVQAAQRTVADGAAYWSACREEQAALRTALAVSEAANRSWERCFMEKAPTGGVRAVCAEGAARTRSEESGEETGGTAETEAGERAAHATAAHRPGSQDEARSLEAVLEAKVVDLALSLQAATQQAATATAQHDQLSALVLLDAGLLTACQAELAVVRPVAASLASEWTALQATSVVAEARHDALLHAYEALLEEFTQEALHTHALELALAQSTMRVPAGFRTAPSTPAVVSAPLLSVPLGRVQLPSQAARQASVPEPPSLPSAPPQVAKRLNLSNLLPRDRKRPHS